MFACVAQLPAAVVIDKPDASLLIPEIVSVELPSSLKVTLGSNASVLTLRLDFTKELINQLEDGSAKLVNADLNEESATLLTLQTRQQLGTIGLSIAQQSEQSILRLF
jgi:flagellin-like hook-associated protein FlgL